jgi:hypothetical protein
MTVPQSGNKKPSIEEGYVMQWPTNKDNKVK